MAEVRFHPEASDEYQAALRWYLARSPQAAASFEIEAGRVLAMIEANPSRFTPYDDEHRYVMLRKYPYSSVSLTRPARVEAVAAHARRSPGYWRGRK